MERWYRWSCKQVRHIEIPVHIEQTSEHDAKIKYNQENIPALKHYWLYDMNNLQWYFDTLYIIKKGVWLKISWKI
jgi:hypothetical protein